MVVMKAVLSALFLFGILVSLQADGYRNPPPTAEGIGKSGVNRAFVDDASAISYNPANLAGQTNGSIVASVVLVRSENTYRNAGSQAVSEGDWQPMPNLYVSAPLKDTGLVWGLGVTTPHGQGAEYDRELLSPLSIFEATMSLIDIKPTVAYKFTDKLLVGGGMDLYLSRLQFKQNFPLGAPPAPVSVAEVDADGEGVGGSLGVAWLLSDRQRLALTYRTTFSIDYEGDYNLEGAPESDFSTEIRFPNAWGLGYGIELGDSVRVEANVEWMQWSANKSMAIELDNAPFAEIPNDWDDTFTWGIGGDWQFADAWTLRAGYAFIESPIPDATVAPILPDLDRHAFSFGLGYRWGRHLFDVAYSYSIYDDRRVGVGENGAYAGSYQVDSDLVGVTYSLAF